MARFLILEWIFFKPGDDQARQGSDKEIKIQERDESKHPEQGSPESTKVPSPQQTSPAKPGEPVQKAPQRRSRKRTRHRRRSQAPHRIVIRSGELEFEVDSFDAAVATITKLVTATKGGFVATVNSDKLANGKVRGSVVVRVPPDQLDKFVLDLRKELGKTGELKNQRIGSQDITKQYTDLESRLRAARTMEERLLTIIKDGKGADQGPARWRKRSWASGARRSRRWKASCATTATMVALAR